MKIAVPVQGAAAYEQVSPLFGRAPYLLVYDTDTKEWSAVSNKINLEAAQGAGIQTAQRVAEAKASVLLSGQVGPKAFRVLAANQIAIYAIPSDISVQEALEQYQTGSLTVLTAATNEGHVI